MSEKKFTLKCLACEHQNEFDQPYPYHSGFSDQGFLYSESGHFTLVWSWYDPEAEKFFPQGGWRLEQDLMIRQRFEDALQPAPDGGRWKFSNPARCMHCSARISGPMLETIYYFVYPGSIVTDANDEMRLRAYLKTN